MPARLPVAGRVAPAIPETAVTEPEVKLWLNQDRLNPLAQQLKGVQPLPREKLGQSAR